jgi:hypothetical protein
MLGDASAISSIPSSAAVPSAAREAQALFVVGGARSEAFALWACRG